MSEPYGEQRSAGRVTYDSQPDPQQSSVPSGDALYEERPPGAMPEDRPRGENGVIPGTRRLRTNGGGSGIGLLGILVLAVIIAIIAAVFFVF